MPKIEYGYEPRQVLFWPPTDYSGRSLPRSTKARRRTDFVGVTLYDWTGGGYRRAKRRDLSVPLQIGNMDWGFTPAVLE
jgi:hypothetical protein